MTGQASTRLRATAVPLASIAEDLADAHTAVHGATAAVAAQLAAAHAAGRETKAQRRRERLSAIEARNKNAAGPAE
jgi:hypothetical protein